MVFTTICHRDWISHAEDVADEILRRSKTILPTVARACLVATFLEDGYRMWSQWDDHTAFIDSQWSCGHFFASWFVLTNLLGQLVGSGLVLKRCGVEAAVSCLSGIVILQTIAYSIHWNFKFFLRNLSLCGALLLILAESRIEVRSLFAGIPSLGEKDKTKTYLEASGRILVVFMFATVLHLEFTLLSQLQNLVAIALMILVTIGFKAKLSSLVLVFWLTVLNFYSHPFWLFDSHRPMHDFLKYDFFQTLSVIGGLLMIVQHGPGSLSIDSHKKEW